MTAAEARAALEREGAFVVLLVDGSRFCGAVTEVPADADPGDRATRFVDASAPVAREDTPVSDALALLDERAHGRIVVLDGEHLAGLVCMTEDGGAVLRSARRDELLNTRVGEAGRPASCTPSRQAVRRIGTAYFSTDTRRPGVSPAGIALSNASPRV